MKKGWMVAVLVTGLLTPSGVALAHEQSKFDGADAGGPLDFIWRSFSETEDNRVYLCVKMARPWPTWKLRGERRYIYFELDTRHKDDPEYYIEFFNRNGQLKARITNKRFDHKATAAGYRFAQKKGACVSFKARLLKPIKFVVRWRVYSGSPGAGCKGIADRGPRFCFDDSRFVRHRWA